MREKSLLVAIPIAPVMIYLAPRRSGRWRRLVREGCVLGAVATGYGLIYLALTRRDSTGPFPVEFRWQPIDSVLRSFGELAGHLLAPGLLGGPWGTLPTEAALQAHPAGRQVALTGVVVGVGLLVATAVRRSAWVPLSMVAARPERSTGGPRPDQARLRALRRRHLRRAGPGAVRDAGVLAPEEPGNSSTLARLREGALPRALPWAVVTALVASLGWPTSWPCTGSGSRPPAPG